jgi:FkbM family methyltransferase
MRNLCRIKPINFSKTFNLGSYTDFSPLSLIQSLNLKVSGVVQVGAHIGQEIETLKSTDKNLRFLVFEPYENCLKILKDRYLNDQTVKIVGKALGSKKTFGLLRIASNEGQSSSLLEPKEHLVKAPHITFSGSAKVEIDTLDSYKSIINEYNFLIVDTQGYELEVLKGGGQ